MRLRPLLLSATRCARAVARAWALLKPSTTSRPHRLKCLRCILVITLSAPAQRRPSQLLRERLGTTMRCLCH
jgi:hypothetical protein